MISNKEKIKAVLRQYSNVVEQDETLKIALVEDYFTVAAEQILSVLSTSSDTPPQLNKHDVSRSAEFEKQLPLPSEAEIIEGAKRLWKLPMKLDAVKQVMRLGYNLKDAKMYCEQHFG